MTGSPGEPTSSTTPTVSMTGQSVPGRPDSHSDGPFGRLAPQGVPVRPDPHSDRPVRVFPRTCRPPGNALR